MDIYQWIGTGIAIFVVLFGLYKWVVIRGDKRRGDLRDAHERTLKEHSDRMDRHSERLGKLDELIALTRREMSRNHPRLEQIEKLESGIKEEIRQVHERLGGMSRDLNQAIGTLKANHNSEITKLVEQIRDAIGGR